MSLAKKIAAEAISWSQASRAAGIERNRAFDFSPMAVPSLAANAASTWAHIGVSTTPGAKADADGQIGLFRRPLAVGLAHLVHSFNPDAVLLGGLLAPLLMEESTL